MTVQRRVGVAFLVVGVVSMLGADYISRRVQREVFRIPAPSTPGATVETTVVLPSAGRYQVQLDFAAPPGSEARHGVFNAPLPLSFQADVDGRSWSTDSTDPTGSYGTGTSAGLLLGPPFRAQGGEHVRFVARAQPALLTLGDLHPHVELRRSLSDVDQVTGQMGVLTLGGIVSILAGLWLSLRRPARGQRAAA